METQAEISGPTAPRRPTGVTVAAVVLGLMACGIFLMGCLMIAVAVAIYFSYVPNTAPLMDSIEVVMGIVILATAGICGAIVIGLFKRRNWARIGIVVVGVLQALTCFGMSALYLTISMAHFPTPPSARPVDPAKLKAIMDLASGLFFLAAMVGAWWGVYFNLRRIRTWFAGDPVEGTMQPSGDNSLAVRPDAGTTEVLLIVLSAFLFLGGISSIVSAGVHLPLFFAGAVLRGHAATAVWLTLAVLSIGVGVGLLWRDKVAWWGAFVIQAHAFVGWVAMLLPQTHQRMLSYQQEVQSTYSNGATVGQANWMGNNSLIVALSIIGLLFFAAITWLLVRARPLFFPARDI